MERYFKRKSGIVIEAPSEVENSALDQPSHAKQSRVETDLSNLPSDPGMRKKISEYHPDERDKIRRAYLQRGPCQPREHKYPQTKSGDKFRRFVATWFDCYGNWLEYSISKDAAFCLCCYLFRPEDGEQASRDSFVVEGFSNWKKKERFDVHVGNVNSAHNQALGRCRDLMNEKQPIQVFYGKHTTQSRIDYRIRITATLDCIRYLLCQGLPFRGHDESKDSINRGNFIQLLEFLTKHNETIDRVCLENAPGNCICTAHDIQKDLVNAAAIETTTVIIEDLNHGLFSILLDESRDVSTKEQMAAVLRYVDSRGCVIERFLGIVHVPDTKALSLKEAIEALFLKHDLSISRLRGQGYDGASNMQGDIGGLKRLIMNENTSAYYIHCFAHQLQLSLVAVAKKHPKIALLFNLVSHTVNVVGASCKRRDMLREKQASKLVQAIQGGGIFTGKGLNQETSLQRAGDTRWSSHYGSLVSLISMFSSTIDVIEDVLDDGLDPEKSGDASQLLDDLQSFEFVFNSHLMRTILKITNELCLALQRKDQDIVNAMVLVKVAKQRLQGMRDEGWESLLNDVSSFCLTNQIDVPDMNNAFKVKGRPRRNSQVVTNLHHYQVELFYTVVDLQLQELNNRFNEANMELLLCVACLNPSDAFVAFDKQKLVRLARFYPYDFSTMDIHILEDQLETYIYDMKSSIEFGGLNGIGDLSQKLVETKRHVVYPLVYLLVKLALILPVATASVERVFSAMKLVKTRLRNRIGDAWMNDCLVTFIEKEIFSTVENENILQRYQKMDTRKEKL